MFLVVAAPQCTYYPIYGLSIRRRIILMLVNALVFQLLLCDVLFFAIGVVLTIDQGKLLLCVTDTATALRLWSSILSPPSFRFLIRGRQHFNVLFQQRFMLTHDPQSIRSPSLRRFSELTIRFTVFSLADGICVFSRCLSVSCRQEFSQLSHMLLPFFRWR